MDDLCRLVKESEEWLVKQLVEYARRNNYTDSTSTLERAWRMSISGLSSAFLDFCSAGRNVELDYGEDYASAPEALFAVEEARRHRERGIELAPFLGLLKYYRQSYLDLLKRDRSCLNNGEDYGYLVNRFFDRLELGVCAEWQAPEKTPLVQELQGANRKVTNEKNKYLTLFESLPNPAFFMDRKNRVENKNSAAAELLEEIYIPGTYYYDEEKNRAVLKWFESELDYFTGDSFTEKVFEKKILTIKGVRYFEVKMQKMLDISEKFMGTVIILNDVTQRNAMQQELMKNEEKFRKLFRNINDAVFLHDLRPDGMPGRFVEVNNVACEWLGYTRDELLAMSPDDINARYYREGISKKRIMSKLEREGHMIFETELMAKNGRHLPVELNSYHFVLNGSKVVLSVARDITERKQYEQALLREKEWLSVVLSSIGDAVIAVDRNERINLINNVASSLTGWQRNEAVGRRLDEVFSIYNEQTGEKPHSPVQKVLNTGKIVGLANHAELLSRDGTRYSIADSAAPIKDSFDNTLGVILVFRDVTQQREQEKIIQEREELFRLLAENAKDIIYRMRLYPEEKFEYVSPSVTRITGYTPEDHYRDPHLGFKIVHPEDREVLQTLLSSEWSGYTYTLRWIRKDGRVIWTEQHNTPIYDGEGKLVAVEGICRDVTIRKQTEEKLRRSEEFNRAVLDSLSENLAILDNDGNIIAVNKSWMKFAMANGIKDVSVVSEGNNYLEVCRRAGGESSGMAREVVKGIKKVIKGVEKRFTMEYPCHTPDKKRWFVMYVTPLQVTEGGAVVSHFDITVRKAAEENLRRAHRQQEEIIEFLPDPTMVVDNESRVIAWNLAMEELTGICKEEMLGYSDYGVLFYRDVSPMLIDYVNYREEDIPLRRYYYVRKQNNILYAEGHVPAVFEGRGANLWMKASPLFDSEGNLMGAIETIRDVTERREIEDKLEYLSFHDPLTGLYNRNCFEQEMSRLEEEEAAPVGIIVCDVDGLKLVNDTLGHEAGDKLLVEAAGIISSTFRKNDIVARIGGDEFAVLIHGDVENELERITRRFKNNAVLYNETGPDVPISISAGYAYRDDPGIKMKEIFKEADNNMYREKLHQGKSARSAIVQTLAGALEARDFITEGHGDRLQDLVVELARAMQLPERRLSDLRLLAQFHDIGKVGIPDRILFKEGPLTPEETIEMRRHCEIGYRIAQSSPELLPVADHILKHHEWWNGGGYPLGLVGRDTPLECRILSVVDAYDAMTSERPYRKGISHQEAINEIIRCAGTQFDPSVVEKFLELFK